MTVPAGLHIVTKRPKGKPVVHYVYAWRGGPQILRKEGGAKPAITAELTDAAAQVRAVRPAIQGDTMRQLIERREASPEFRNKLAKSTQSNHRTWHNRIAEKFGDAPIAMFTDHRVRADVLEWRDQWAEQPRSADAAIASFVGLLNFAVDRGLLKAHALEGVSRLYETDRSEVIWEAQHFTQIAPHAAVEVQEAIDLAGETGLRRGDLVKLPWSAIGEHAIVWKTGKSSGRTMITVPLLPGAKEVIARIKARHEREMAERPPAKRKPLPATVLSNSRWLPWTASGFGSRFNDAKQASGFKLNFHDLRGTFATRCMVAGLTDEEIARILGWENNDVAKIRARYVSDARVVIAIGERIAKAKEAA